MAVFIKYRKCELGGCRRYRNCIICTIYAKKSLLMKGFLPNQLAFSKFSHIHNLTSNATITKIENVIENKLNRVAMTEQ